jgi:hypothetical protein
MKQCVIATMVLLGCGAPTGGSLTLNFPAAWVGEGILHGAIFEAGQCSELASPIDLNSALVRLSHPADFDAQNEHPMTLSSIPAGDGRMIVAVVEQNDEQVCHACADGILIEDGGIADVRLILRNCP